MILQQTFAMMRGDSYVTQCAYCGCLLATTSSTTTKDRDLGPCPACGGTEWWPQQVPVGPFRKADN